MAQAAVLITHHEVFGANPSIQDLHGILREYRRAEVLVLLSKLNCILGTWRNAPDFDLDTRLCRLVFPNYRSTIEAIRKDKVGRVLLSRLTILYLIKQACLACPADGERVEYPRDVERIGVCCLMANDLILTTKPSPQDATLERLTSLLPFSDYVSHEEFPNDIARALTMFEETSRLPQLQKRPDYFDLGRSFREQIGLAPHEFCELVFGAATKYLNLKVEELEEAPDALFLRPEYFRKTKVAPESAARFLGKVAKDEAEFAKNVNDSRDRPGDDLTLIQRHPMLDVSEGLYFCLDPGFLVDKAGRGLYWTLFVELQGDQERLNLASFWGAIFEEYVNSIIAEGYSAGGRFVPGPKFENGDQAFDAYLIEGSSMVVFEHKSSVLRADAKYGGDPQKLEEDLMRKFVRGDDDGAKGLAQLERHVERFLSGGMIDDVSADNISTIYPVLVCYDRSLLAPFMNRYLNKNFAGYSLRKTYRKTITPVFTLGISEAERLLPHLHEFRLTDILESYYRANREMLSPISSAEVPILKGARRGRDPVGERFSRFTKRMEFDLFGVVRDDQPKP